eukprot:NODE_640_length_5666_cov_0.633196.p5 type:complete len:110 gc:universal NODE_640_length_5666_cov_0.633196:4874-4545(-)
MSNTNNTDNQSLLLANSQSLQTVQNQLKNIASHKKKTQIVEKTIIALPDDTRMYSSIGKVFIPKTKEQVKSMCTTDIKELDETFMTLLKKKGYFEKQIVELQKQQMQNK